MLVHGVKERTGTLRKLKNLINDEDRKVHGVFYTNSFFTQRYLSRAHQLVEDIDIANNHVKLKVATRLERVGMLEIEATLDKLRGHKAGDIPGLTNEGMVNQDNFMEGRPFIPEDVSLNQFLFTVDLVLLMDEPTVTFQEFNIAGSKFTLINLHHTLYGKDEEMIGYEQGYEDEDEDDEEVEFTDFNQTVTFLFGEADKMYFYSHFYNKDLSKRDMKLILDLITDENITGKAFKGVQMVSRSGSSSNFYPLDSLINSYKNKNGDYIFSSLTGLVRLRREAIEDYRLMCLPATEDGGYELFLYSKDDSISILTE